MIIKRILSSTLVALGLLGFCALARAEQPINNPAGEIESTDTSAPIFASGLPVGYRLMQEGNLSPKEGVGTFQILSHPKDKITAVIIDVEALSWLKTKQLKSTNPLIVSRHIVSRFFPSNPDLKVSRHETLNLHSQLASHLLITDNKGLVEPAITLRILFPRGRAVFLLLRQSGFTSQNQDFASAYQLQETLAQHLMDQIYIPDTPSKSEQMILLNLRKIFKGGVFTHRAP